MWREALIEASTFTPDEIALVRAEIERVIAECTTTVARLRHGSNRVDPENEQMAREIDARICTYENIMAKLHA